MSATVNETFQLVVKPLNIKVGHNKPAIELIVHFHSKLGVTSFQQYNLELELGLKPLSAQIGAVCVCWLEEKSDRREKSFLATMDFNNPL